MPTKLREIATIKAAEGTVWCARWRPQGDFFVACGQDKVLRLFDSENRCIQEENKDERVHSRSLRRVAWRGDGQQLAVASFDAKISLWKLGDFLEMSATLVGHENEVKSVAYNPDGELLASCSRDKSVFVYDVTGDAECVGVLQGHTQDVKNVVFSPDGDYLVSTSYDDTIRIWTREVDEDEWHLLSTLRSHTATVWAAAFNEASEWLVTVSADSTMKIWKVGRKVGSSEGNLLPPSIPVWLISPLIKGAYRVDDASQWKLVCTVQGVHGDVILDVAWCGDLIATVCGDNKLRVFQVDKTGTPECVDVLQFSCEPNSVQWRPGCSRRELLVGLDDGTVRRVALEI